MSYILRLLEKIDLVFDQPPSAPIQVQVLGRTVTAPDPLPLLPVYMTGATREEWPIWLQKSHWLWTGALTNGKDRVSVQKRRSDGRHYRTTQPARPVTRVNGELVQVQYPLYALMFGPDQSPPGQYRRLKHRDDICPHDFCVNPLHWTPVQSQRRRVRKKYQAPVATAEQEMQELIELIELIEDKMAVDRSQNFEEFWEIHFTRLLYTQDEVRAAIRTIGGNVQRKLLGEEQHDGSCTA